ncbi:MAG: phosphoribosylformylglycinamidine cyclo-ligase [Candidatus Methylomirabilales bacterium]
MGYYASVIELPGGIGIALTADGVGTKLLVAQMLDKFDTVGIDCVAMNVNDLLCVGAEPVAMLDIIALERSDPRLLREIGKGLFTGAQQADISIPGGEIAEVKEMLRGSRRGCAFDLSGMAIGLVPVDRIILGQHIAEGDVLIGLPSSGIHSNGLTLARKTLFRRGKLKIDQYLPELGQGVGEALLTPTRIYVRPIRSLLDQVSWVRALFHITGDGFFNLTRAASEVGFVIEALPERPAIFRVIQEIGQIAEGDMFRVFNMGVGFAVVVPEAEADRALTCLRDEGIEGMRLGYALRDGQRRIRILPPGLVGRGGRFRKR